MKLRPAAILSVILAVLAVAWTRCPAHAAELKDAQSSSAPTTKETSVTTHQAKGPFDVKLAPFKSDGIDASFGAMSIDKQFHGALEATSKGTMLAFQSGAKGSAGYVALEKVDGTLDGRKGTFVLQHNATMDRGTPSLSIIVVPDSGTGELTGLAGKVNIDIAAGGKHSYIFDYTLPAAQ
jgi:Protein of unknown function (DUF3224)